MATSNDEHQTSDDGRKDAKTSEEPEKISMDFILNFYVFEVQLNFVNFFLSENEHDLTHSLSDAGIYSCAAICALSLHELFDNEWDRDFNKLCLKTILDHLKLPKQV